MGGIYLLKSLTIGDLLALRGVYIIDSDRGILKKSRKSTRQISVNVIYSKYD